MAESPATSGHPDQPIQTIGLLLLPGFSLGEVGLLSDGVAAVNAQAESVRYALRLYSLDGLPVAASLGRAVQVDGKFDPQVPLAALLVMASATPPELTAGDATVAALGLYARHRTLIGGVHAGAFWLAAAGLLSGCRATVHWSLLDLFVERYPNIIATSSLFELDRGRLSCGGGVAVADMLLHLVARLHGAELATGVADHLLLDRLRGKDDRQRIPLRNQPGGTQPKLVQAVTLMEANLEEPLTTDEIAQHVCISRRQLERLFKQHLDRVPSQYYLELRLNRARQMLRQTSKSIIQIGLSCGFSSGPHFSSAYRNHFGVTPREDRQRAAVHD